MARAGELLALTLWRPWAWSVATGAKRIENRGWRPPPGLIGQRLAIHAGEKWDPDGDAFLRARGLVMPDAQAKHIAGAIIGVVTVRGFLWVSECAGYGREERTGDELEAAKVRILGNRGYGADQAAMFFGPCGWLVSDAVELASPIRARGAQRLWKVQPTAAAEVLAQL